MKAQHLVKVMVLALGHIPPFLYQDIHLDSMSMRARGLVTEAHCTQVGSPLDPCILADEDFHQLANN